MTQSRSRAIRGQPEAQREEPLGAACRKNALRCRICALTPREGSPRLGGSPSSEQPAWLDLTWRRSLASSPPFF